MLYTFLRVLCQILLKIFFFYRAEGVEHIPRQGRVMICCNHISNIDPPLVGSACPRPIHFLAKAELFRNRLFGSLLRKIYAIPVKRGSADRQALRQAMQVLKDGEIFGIFPEGSRHTNQAQKGAAVIALKTKTPIVPATIIGNYRLFRPMRIVFGKPIEIEPYLQEKVTDEVVQTLTQRIMTEIETLKTKR